MSKLRDALVTGLISMVLGVVFTLAASLLVPPPLALPLLVALIAGATFLVGVVGDYSMESEE
jgi:NhaP-type Na+/H+ or K+/H+ antiporter